MTGSSRKPDGPRWAAWFARGLTPWRGVFLLAGLLAGCSTTQLQSWSPEQTIVLPVEEARVSLMKVEQPSNCRNWSPDEAVLAYAELEGEQAHVHNIRNCTYLTEDSYVVGYYDKTYDLSKLRSIDFITVPFKGMPSMAHTMLSFGFEGDDYLALSVEIRREQGEQYQFLNGILRQYEIIYILGDERDLIRLRTNYRKDDVYIYRVRATPEQIRRILVDVVQRANKLRTEPEFYNTFTNNCTTNIVRHVNNLWPDRVPYDYRVLLPGLTAELAYELGLLETDGSFEETKQRAWVNDLALEHADSPQFSAQIRQRITAAIAAQKSAPRPPAVARARSVEGKASPRLPAN